MAKNKFSYIGLENLSTELSERPFFMHFKLIWKETGETLASIITNRYGCGRWTDLGGKYRQVAGTAQYSLPSSEGGVRRALRVMAAERIGAELDILPMAYMSVTPWMYDDSGVMIDNPDYPKAERKAMEKPAYIKRKKELESMLKALQGEVK